MNENFEMIFLKNEEKSNKAETLFLLKSTQKDFTQELKNLIQEKFPEELHETTFYRNKDFKKFIEIK
ncbi:hypothetical protein BpHYR1_048994, partial [Brachionus plicatilis]